MVDKNIMNRVRKAKTVNNEYIKREPTPKLGAGQGPFHDTVDMSKAKVTKGKRTQ